MHKIPITETISTALYDILRPCNAIPFRYAKSIASERQNSSEWKILQEIADLAMHRVKLQLFPKKGQRPQQNMLEVFQRKQKLQLNPQLHTFYVIAILG